MQPDMVTASVNVVSPLKVKKISKHKPSNVLYALPERDWFIKTNDFSSSSLSDVWPNHSDLECLAKKAGVVQIKLQRI